jgi:hypothetical protein
VRFPAPFTNLGEDMNTEELITDLRAEARMYWPKNTDETDNTAVLLRLAADEIERLRKIEREMNALASIKPLTPGGLE